jgi:hypothetical protein
MEIRPPFWGVLGILLISIVGVVMLGTSQGGFFLRLMYLCIFLIGMSWVWSFISVRGFKLNRFARGVRQQLGQVFEERLRLSIQIAWFDPGCPLRMNRTCLVQEDHGCSRGLPHEKFEIIRLTHC